MGTMFRCAAGAAFAVSLLASGSALAQVAAEQDADREAGAAGDGGVASSDEGDIIVTARRVAERLQDVPVAVTAFGEEALEQRNATRISDLSSLAPGLSVMQGNVTGASIAYFSLRGQAQRSDLATTDPSIGVYVDDVYWARAYGVNANLMDTSSVQVLRGPQGTLFGRNTTGGAILLTTNKPELGDFSGSMKIGYGRFDAIEGTAIVNAPLGDNVALRLAGQFVDDDGYVRDRLHPRHRYGDEGNQAARAKLLVQLSDDLSMTLSADWFREKKNPSQGEFRFVTDDSPASLQAGSQILGSAACFADFAACAIAGRARLDEIIVESRENVDTISANLVPETSLKTETYALHSEYETGFGGTLKFVGAYRKVRNDFFSDYDATEIRIAEYSGHLAIRQWSAELNLTGSGLGDRLQYAAGLFYFDEEGVDSSRFVAVPGLNPSVTIYDGRIDNRSIGIYSQFDFSLTDKLSFTGGLRWSQDKKAVTINNGADTGDIFTADPGSFTCAVQAGCPTTRSGKFDGVSFTLGANYKFSPNLLLYGKVARAFRSGGVNLRETTLIPGQSFAPFKPEQITSYEGGLKSELFDRRVRFNLAGYYMVADDIQREFVVSFFDENAGNSVNVTIASNAERADFWGGEAELSVKLVDTGTDSLTLDGNAALVKARYKKYIDPSTGFDKSRERFTNVPEWTFSVGGTYKRSFEAADLTLSTNYAWEDSLSYTEFNFYRDADGTPRDASSGAVITNADPDLLKSIMTKKPSGQLNARLAAEFGANRQYEVSLWGQNILDNRDFLSSNQVVALGINALRRRPATYGVSLGVRF